MMSKLLDGLNPAQRESVTHTLGPLLIKKLIDLHCPEAIAIEKIEIGSEATIEDWFHYVAGCVSTINTIDKFKETLYIDPIYTDAFVGLSRAQLAQNKIEEAENAAAKALRLKDNLYPDAQQLLDAIGQYRLGCKSLNNKKWNIAIDKFKEAINREPIFTEAHCGLSKANLYAGNLKASKNAVEEALRLINDYRPARKLLSQIKMGYYDKGKIYFNREEYNQAISKFQMALEIDQDFKDAHRFIGETYLILGDLKKAEKSVREALRIDSFYQLAQELLEKIKLKHKEQGDEHQNREDYYEAVKSYQQAIRIDDKYKNAYNSLGIVYWKMKEYNRAIDAYQQAKYPPASKRY